MPLLSKDSRLFEVTRLIDITQHIGSKAITRSSPRIRACGERLMVKRLLEKFSFDIDALLSSDVTSEVISAAQ